LRIRRAGKQRLQTIKWAKRTALFDRGQSETQINSIAPDWEAARGTALEPLLGKKLRRSLKPLFETRISRTIYPISTEAAEIEVAVDHGSIRAGQRTVPIRELELELKRGQSSELFRIARELSRNVPARLTLKSKAERGYELLNGGSRIAVKAAEVEFPAGTSTIEAFRIIARSCLAQIVANEAGVQGRDSEALHQIRIGMRRLRAAISLFSEMLAGTQTEFVKSELKWITAESSLARDLDVHISEVLAPSRNEHESNADFQSLCRDFERRRAEAFHRAADAFRSDRYRYLLIELAAWIEVGTWSNLDDDAKRARNERPIEIYAAEQLTRRRKKIVKKAKIFCRLQPEQRHRLRIAVKKFRYIAEFVGSVFPAKKSTKRRTALLGSVKRIQNCLGALNDIAVHEKLHFDVIRERDNSLTTTTLCGRAFIVGLISGQEKARADQLTADAALTFTEFRAAKPFWK